MQEIHAGDLGSHHAKVSDIHLLLLPNLPHPLSLFPQPPTKKNKYLQTILRQKYFFLLYHDYCVFCQEFFLFKLTLLYFYQKPIQIRTSRSSCFLSVFPHALLSNGSTLTSLQCLASIILKQYFDPELRRRLVFSMSYSQSGGSGFKSWSGHFLDLFSNFPGLNFCCLEFKTSAILINSQLVFSCQLGGFKFCYCLFAIICLKLIL